MLGAIRWAISTVTEQYWVLSANRRNLPIIQNLRNGKPITHGFRMKIQADCVFRTHVLLKNGLKVASYMVADNHMFPVTWRSNSAGFGLEPQPAGRRSTEGVALSVL